MAGRSTGVTGQLKLDLSQYNPALQKALADTRNTVKQIAAIPAPKFQAPNVGAMGGILPKPDVFVRAQTAVRGLSREMQGGHTSASRFGQGMLQLGYLTDDAAYGMRGIMNNIAPLALGLGAGMGLAGALQILGVALQQGIKYWDDWTGATAKAANETKALAEYEKRVAEAIERANAAGKASGQAETGLLDRQKAGRASQDRFDTSAGRMENFRDPGGAELRDASQKLIRAEERLAQDQEQLGVINNRLAAAQAELAPLEEKRTLTRKEQDRKAFLQGEIPSLSEARDTLDERAGEGIHQVEELRQGITEEMAKKGIGAVVDFLEGLHDRAKAANEADERAWEQQKRESAAARSAARGALNAAVETIEKDSTRDKTLRDLAISETRNPRRRAKLRRAEDVARERDRLVEEEGMRPGQAAEVAERKQKVADREAGIRTIRGAKGPDRPFEGLDAFRDRTLPAEKEQKRREAAAAKRVDAGERDVSKRASDPGLKPIADKLESILNAIQNPPDARIKQSYFNDS